MSNKWTQTRRSVGLCLLIVSQTFFVPCYGNKLKPRLIYWRVFIWPQSKEDITSSLLCDLANCALSVAFTKQLSSTELHIKSIDANL